MHRIILFQLYHKHALLSRTRKNRLDSQNLVEPLINKEKTMDECCSREKYWSELSLEEKVERMRSIVKRLQRTVNDLGMDIRMLNNHDHLDGEIVVKQKSLHSSPNECSGTNDNEVYF